MALNLKQGDYEKMRHIESFALPDKTIAEFKPRFWRDKEYVVAILKKSGKKSKGQDYYEPIYKSKSFDSSIFVYNNIHVMDVMNMKRRKQMLRLKTQIGENVEKVLFLDADIDLQSDKRKTIAKAKELKVNVIKVFDKDEICYE